MWFAAFTIPYIRLAHTYVLVFQHDRLLVATPRIYTPYFFHLCHGWKWPLTTNSAMFSLVETVAFGSDTFWGISAKETMRKRFQGRGY